MNAPFAHADAVAPPDHPERQYLALLADILESVEELRYYRETVFVPQPGPTSDQARTIAARIRGEDPPAPPEAAPTP